MDIRNKTKKPLRIPLPAGKRLFLPPGATGQIAPKAATHPPLQKMIEADELEIVGEGRSSGGSGSSGGGVSGSQNNPSGAGLRHTGDR
ncbi:MAG: hypothetical protein AAF368_03895 [Planctomycetota bacterium]